MIGSRAVVPVGLMMFALGMVVGNLVGGWLADRAVIRSLYLSIAALAVMLTVFVVRPTIPSLPCWCCSGSAPPVALSQPACRSD